MKPEEDLHGPASVTAQLCREYRQPAYQADRMAGFQGTHRAPLQQPKKYGRVDRLQPESFQEALGLSKAD